MANVKPVPMQKRIAMGEKVTGMKRGGAVRTPNNPPKNGMHKNMKKGGKGC